MVGHVDGSIDAFQEHEIAFYPFAKGEILDVDMPGACSGFLGITHCRASVVVFKQDSCGLLWNV